MTYGDVMHSHFKVAQALCLGDPNKFRQRCLSILGKENLAIEKKKSDKHASLREVIHVFLTDDQAAEMISRSHLCNRPAAYRELGLESYEKKFTALHKNTTADGYFVRGMSTNICRSETDDTYEILGKKFGKLAVDVVLGRSDHGHLYYGCSCDCGEKVGVYGATLVGGRSKSCGCYKRKKKWESHIAAVFRAYRDGAIKRGYEFNLSIDEIKSIIFKDCHYCGIPPSNSKDVSASRCQKGIMKYNGIDRVDNTRGYSVDNCVPCCYICNRAKSNMDHNDFMSWINAIRRIA